MAFEDERSRNPIFNILILLLLFWFIGFGNIVGLESPLGVDLFGLRSGGEGYTPSGGGGGQQPSIPTGRVYGSAALQWALRDSISGSALTGANEKVDTTIINPDGTIDFTVLNEQVDNAAAQEQSALSYAEGSGVIIHTSSDADVATKGTDYYDGWYYIPNIAEGEPVYEFTADLVEVHSIDSSGKYKYRLKSGARGKPTGHYLQWTSGTTNYWDIGILECHPRVKSTYITFSAAYSSTQLSSVTDASTWDTTTTGAADVTLLSDDEDITVSIDADGTDVCYAMPMLTLTTKGELQTRKAFMIATTNMTKIGISAMQSEGWTKLSDSTLTAEVAFYKEVPALKPTRGDSFGVDIKLPIDASAASASTGYYFTMYLSDFQLESNVAVGGLSTSIPTAYGFLGEFGIDAIIFARAFSTSSGAASGMVLAWVVTTAS